MILFVCVADVCRSPLAAALVGQSLAAADVDLELRSAGIQARVGEQADAGTRAIAQQFGIGVLDHRAQQAAPDLVRQADLVLTATRDVRSEVVRLHPPAVQYAFTIRQLDRTLAAARTPFTPLDGPPEDTLRALRSFTARNRGFPLPKDRSNDDVVDPYGRPRSAYETAIGQMTPGLGALVAAFGARPMIWPRWG